MTLGATGKQIITEDTGATQIISGAIGQSASGFTLKKAGGGTLRFSGTTANTYTGLTDVNNGVLELGKTDGVNAIAGNLQIGPSGSTRVQLLASNQIADTSAVSFLGATAPALRLNGFSETIGSLASSGGAGVVENNTSGTSTLTVSAASGITTFSGVLQDGTAGILALTKGGAGEQRLTGTNTYTGVTNVNAGTLLVNNATGSGTGSGAVTVNGGTLGGSGIITGATTIESGAKLNAGATIGAIGTQTFSGGLDIKQGSIFSWDVDNAATADQIKITGGSLANTGTEAIFQVVLGSADAFVNPFWNNDRSWDIFVNGAGSVLTGGLDSIFAGFEASGGLADTSGNVTGRGQFTLNGSTQTLNWTAVPEPTSALTGLLLGAGLLRRRRQTT
jgi:autotransporter-associated beta strand protein